MWIGIQLQRIVSVRSSSLSKMKPRHRIAKTNGAGKHKDLRKTRGKRVPIESIRSPAKPEKDSGGKGEG